METKQVIVFRHDLLKGDHSIRKGKFGAMCAHASIGSLLTLFNKEKITTLPDGFLEKNQEYYRYSTEFSKDSVLDCWLNGKFKKIVVYVNNEEELLSLNEQLNKTEIPHKLIIDAGLTEFHGISTPVCIGIGPYCSEDIDKYTGNLPLL